MCISLLSYYWCQLLSRCVTNEDYSWVMFMGMGPVQCSLALTALANTQNRIQWRHLVCYLLGVVACFTFVLLVNSHQTPAKGLIITAGSIFMVLYLVLIVFYPQHLPGNHAVKKSIAQTVPIS